MKITVQQALDSLLTHEGKTFLELFRHGAASVEIYQPIGYDPQQPHAAKERVKIPLRYLYQAA
ncbi:MAG: hypothetical protein OHK0019_12440 [Saprospiraceae bacterium]